MEPFHSRGTKVVNLHYALLHHFSYINHFTQVYVMQHALIKNNWFPVNFYFETVVTNCLSGLNHKMLVEGYDYAIFTLITMIFFSLILSSYNRNDTDVPWMKNNKQHSKAVFSGNHK